MGYYIIKKSSKNPGQPYYFILKADNHETIAQSEMYSSKDACKKGIAAVQKNALSTEIREDKL
ncbi:YegP family protein [Citrobacter amalonaticus]|uniref:YegP family protein n=1 Tax=Citrobacter amalonaticus TaxID=35703 RepID=UPI001A31F63F|nr:YegP family protein [Citrobacter amalonaticus]HDQ2814057.1 YegP family protein [Citrobacter amalonaticus]